MELFHLMLGWVDPLAYDRWKNRTFMWISRLVRLCLYSCIQLYYSTKSLQPWLTGHRWGQCGRHMPAKKNERNLCRDEQKMYDVFKEYIKSPFCVKMYGTKMSKSRYQPKNILPLISMHVEIRMRCIGNGALVQNSACAALERLADENEKEWKLGDENMIGVNRLPRRFAHRPGKSRTAF